MNPFILVRPLPAIFSMPKVVHYRICLQPENRAAMGSVDHLQNARNKINDQKKVCQTKT
jgi:hypothetical protein